MRVCIICEGSYPYIAGGVSGWVQMLISEHKDIEFVIWSIATSREEMKDYKYELPSNIVKVKTVYLNDIKFVNKHKKIKLDTKDKAILKTFLMESNDKINWEDILQFLKIHRERLTDIIMSKDFFDIVVEIYKNAYTRITFSTFLWNIRSMYFPLLYILSHEIPKADVYHAVSTGYAGVLGGVASHLFEKSFLLTEHGIYTREREEEIIKSDWVVGIYKEIWIDFFNKLSRIAYKQADKVISLFETNKTLQVELGCPLEKIRIIPNGIDADKLSLIPRRTQQKNEFIHIGILARVVPIKDIKTTLLSYDIAKKQIPNLKLFILGPYDEDLEYYKECVALIEEMSIEDVVFEGRVNVTDYLPKLDIMLLTSISEGQPLAVLEGMAAGIPQICTNVGSCMELLYGSPSDQLGQAGIIVPVMNINSIANAIISLATNEKLRKVMGDIGCNRVMKYYQKENFLNQYQDMYIEMGGAFHGRRRI
ncbi:GT4 family glycosyltransferase PelF [Mobilitalea sibirica]|uniref:GT4 family glycosyltransferase PelF n=1 Tax=Mobilitalea sibirica TaxID=1462919 RepID=A0A8J7HD13_9FIRM|nr:GT4 family glycosyltransferase PelF [Mobilitalea sibirica]MBH1941527.1 GT4 family glycosyltransferase PelF [Mobilitalea sibirica]